MGKTIYTLNNIHAQVIVPSAFRIFAVDKRKEVIAATNFINAGYFTYLEGGKTYPVGNLVINGKIISNAATNPDWINVAKKNLTTLIVYEDNTVEMRRIADISDIPNVKYAISGIPILKEGYSVKKEKVLEEGYFGSELYDTWHNFIGIRGTKIVVVGAKCNYTQMPYLMEVLGIANAMKLDGGGSFIMKSGSFVTKTSENRQIHNIITW